MGRPKAHGSQELQPSAPYVLRPIDLTQGLSVHSGQGSRYRRNMQRYFWFSYPPKPGAWRTPNPKGSRPSFTVFDLHRTRDADMFLSLAGCLEPSCKYGGRICNAPAGMHVPTKREAAPELTHDDLLLLPTRPPLDDASTDHRTILRSNSVLEGQIHSALREVVKYMNRYEVDFCDLIDARIQPHIQRLSVVKYNSKGPALATGDNVSYVYLISFPPGTGNLAPRLCCGFGMGGYETMVFAECIRCDPAWQETVRWALRSDRPCAVVGELSANYHSLLCFPEVPPQVAVTERFRVMV